MATARLRGRGRESRVEIPVGRYEQQWRRLMRGCRRLLVQLYSKTDDARSQDCRVVSVCLSYSLNAGRLPVMRTLGSYGYFRLFIILGFAPFSSATRCDGQTRFFTLERLSFLVSNRARGGGSSARQFRPKTGSQAAHASIRLSVPVLVPVSHHTTDHCTQTAPIAQSVSKSGIGSRRGQATRHSSFLSVRYCTAASLRPVDLSRVE